jgi:ribosomal protein S18 acetylase RimI-like enzyme
VRLQQSVEISIRRATDADIGGILACLQLAFEPYKTSYTPAAYEDTVPTFSGVEQRLREMCVLVAVNQANEILGTLAYRVMTNNEGHLRGMAILPQWQRRGLAKRLLDRAESELRERNCSRCTLDTTLQLTDAIRFYESNGYVATGKSDLFGVPLIDYVKQL